MKIGFLEFGGSLFCSALGESGSLTVRRCQSFGSLEIGERRWVHLTGYDRGEGTFATFGSGGNGVRGEGCVITR